MSTLSTRWLLNEEAAYLWELAGDEAKHKRLVFRQEFERFKSTRTLRVVLEVVAVNIDLLEELDSDPVITSLTEVYAILSSRELLLTRSRGVSDLP